MGKKKDIVLVTFIDGEEKRTVEVERGTRIKLKNGRFICAGVTPKEELGPNITFSEAEDKPKTLKLFKSKK